MFCVYLVEDAKWFSLKNRCEPTRFFLAHPTEARATAGLIGARLAWCRAGALIVSSFTAHCALGCALVLANNRRFLEDIHTSGETLDGFGDLLRLRKFLIYVYVLVHEPMRPDTTILWILLTLVLMVNGQHNRSQSHARSSESETADSTALVLNVDDEVPREPRRFYDSKYHSRQAMRINVPTRGEPPTYQQVGLLHESGDSENIKPLYGRQTYPGSNQWNYFTSTDSHLATKIPVERESQDCTDERGCQELHKNDTLNVLNKDYQVNLYGTIAPRYIPY